MEDEPRELIPLRVTFVALSSHWELTPKPIPYLIIYLKTLTLESDSYTSAPCCRMGGKNTIANFALLSFI